MGERHAAHGARGAQVDLGRGEEESSDDPIEVKCEEREGSSAEESSAEGSSAEGSSAEAARRMPVPPYPTTTAHYPPSCPGLPATRLARAHRIRLAARRSTWAASTWIDARTLFIISAISPSGCNLAPARSSNADRSGLGKWPRRRRAGSRVAWRAGRLLLATVTPTVSSGGTRATSA